MLNSEFKSLTPQEAAKIIEEESDLILLDVREAEEHELCRINGSTLCPLSDFQNSIDKLSLKRNSKILLYCHHGKRSAQAAQYLTERGYENIFNLIGGIDLWSMEIDTSIPRY